MSHELDQLIRNYTIKHDRKIKTICDPLQTYLGISTFAYYSIEDNGSFVIISNFPEQLDFFYSSHLYLNCPYLVHPSLFRSGYALIPLADDQEKVNLSRKLYGIDHFLLMLFRVGNKIEGFFFNAKNPNDQFIDRLDLLSKFVNLKGSYSQYER